MTPREFTHLPSELFELLEALCEDRLDAVGVGRLEQLVVGDVVARRVYLAYVDLHGTLHWNAAYGESDPLIDTAITSTSMRRGDENSRGTLLGHSPITVWIAVAAVVCVAVLSFSLGRLGSPTVEPELVENRNQTPHKLVDALPMTGETVDASVRVATERMSSANPVGPVVLNDSSTAVISEGLSGDVTVNSVGSTEPVVSRGTEHPLASLPPTSVASRVPEAQTSRSVASVIAVINEHLAAGWKVQGVEPSPLADDAEWLRRVYLDVAGHIPPVDVAEHFLTDRSAEKRERLVDSLLDSPDYVRHWTNVWTNLLVGRSDSRDVDRAALQKFLRTSIAKNRPWNDIVAQFISAEGRFDENGATNFLLAHLNNQAVPATTITAKIFLGRQIGCTQCHDHPFNDWKQETFWAFNSFFQQTKIARVDRRDDRTGKMKSQAAVLETKLVGGPTHYETRRGLMQVTFPKFEGATISDEPQVNRRNELAKLLTSGDKPFVAEAYVNRMWEHFFGCGFTRQVDDMGPHNPPSHPELLDHLAREFVASGYDTKQLIRWVCLNDAYQRTSRFGKFNEVDDPATGAIPLFSRVYLKGMTAEQLYDSLLLATGADRTPLEVGDHERRRHEWLQQFVHAFQTDENDESMNFESTISQALMMMNSDLTQNAISAERGTLLEKLVHGRDSETERLKQLCLATLTRYPTPKEQVALRKLVRDGSGSRTNSAGWQDAMWAYLNSSEFILVH